MLFECELPIAENRKIVFKFLDFADEKFCYTKVYIITPDVKIESFKMTLTAGDLEVLAEILDAHANATVEEENTYYTSAEFDLNVTAFAPYIFSERESPIVFTIKFLVRTKSQDLLGGAFDVVDENVFEFTKKLRQFAMMYR